jgi:predicted RNase H-like HicB family nuclease
MRYAIVYRDEDNNWIVEVPSLPGCRSEGNTREEALENIRDAIKLYLEVLDEDRKELYQEFVDPELVAIEMVTE